MNTLEIKLVDNTYEISESNEVLQQLLTDKINFLKKKRFSSEIRFGHCPTNVEGRLQELEEAKMQLANFFNSLQNTDYEVEIECPVRITIHETQSELSTNSSEENK